VHSLAGPDARGHHEVPMLPSSESGLTLSLERSPKWIVEEQGVL
jgi:hypothetical protein